jgi:hypothetical protein
LQPRDGGTQLVELDIERQLVLRHRLIIAVGVVRRRGYTPGPCCRTSAGRPVTDRADRRSALWPEV